jgi:hypothetical protein
LRAAAADCVPKESGAVRFFWKALPRNLSDPSNQKRCAQKGREPSKRLAVIYQVEELRRPAVNAQTRKPVPKARKIRAEGCFVC